MIRRSLLVFALWLGLGFELMPVAGAQTPPPTGSPAQWTIDEAILAWNRKNLFETRDGFTFFDVPPVRHVVESLVGAQGFQTLKRYYGTGEYSFQYAYIVVTGLAEFEPARRAALGISDDRPADFALAILTRYQGGMFCYYDPDANLFRWNTTGAFGAVKGLRNRGEAAVLPGYSSCAALIQSVTDREGEGETR